MLTAKREVSLGSWRHYSSQCPVVNRCSQYSETAFPFFLSFSQKGKLWQNVLSCKISGGARLNPSSHFQEQEAHKTGFFPALTHKSCNHFRLPALCVLVRRGWCDLANLLANTCPWVQWFFYSVSSPLKLLRGMAKLQESQSLWNTVIPALTPQWFCVICLSLLMLWILCCATTTHATTTHA